jgi:hypothetical protein
MSCGAETEADTLLTSLTAGLNFTIPTVDLDNALFKVPAGLDDDMYKVVVHPSNEDLTTKVVGGSGTFDVLMATVNAHLAVEYEKGRITGAEYTKAYIELTQAAMASSVQFVLNRGQAFWEAQKAQVAAVTGRVQLETTRVELAKSQFDALLSKAEYANAKLKLSTESVQYCTLKFTLDNVLPEQLTLATIQRETASFNLNQMLPEQLQTAQAQREAAEYQISTVLPAQVQLMKEQAEAQHAQTLDIRIDGQAVRGVMGKQKDLYTQQIDSYQKDGRVKIGKIFSDAWLTQKTIDEGVEPPDGFTNASLDTVLTRLKTDLGL